MLFVNPLTEAEQLTLEAMQNNYPLPITRKRAHSILLSNQGYSIPKIIRILGNCCRQSVSRWLRVWDDVGIIGLIERHRSGRPRKLTTIQELEVIESVKENPRGIKKVLAELADKTGISICKETLRRICKRANLRWKRIKKTLKNKRDEASYQECVEMIAELLVKEKQGDIDLFYFDESGFNLQPCVPYAWQETGKNIEVPCSHSISLNVLGFINHSCQFESFIFEGSINTDVVVECFDEFAKTISKPTFVLIDNAPTHTSDFFLAQLNDWEELGLHPIPISAYSPELNIIEILWRKIKYEWMPFSAYESLDTLKKELFNILKNIGDEYVISYT